MNEALARQELVDTMRFFHSRGWTPGTGGNFSIVVGESRSHLLMSPSGVDKGRLTPEQLIVVGEDGKVISGSGKPSAETLIHTTIVKNTGAGSVLHTHSVYNTLISRKFSSKKGITISGFEMLKSLDGNTSHDCEEWVPIISNTQNMETLSSEISEILTKVPSCKAILISGHGLYTWGRDVYSARRHVEGLEFLFEIYWREHTGS